MEGNELNVFAQSYCSENEKEDNLNDNISRNNKTGFRHFVEESTLRNVSLDELEELSEVGCSIADRNIRRTPSSVSSEPPVIRRGFVFEYHQKNLDSTEVFLRVILAVFLVGSLSCVSNSGTGTTDVLEFPYESSIRAHIFIVVLSLLIDITFFIIKIFSLEESFPSFLHMIDSIIHFCLAVVLFITSILLFHGVYNHFDNVDPVLMEDPVVKWVQGHIVASAIMGFFSTLNAAFLIIVRGCSSCHDKVIMTDEIVLTSLRSS